MSPCVTAGSKQTKCFSPYFLAIFSLEGTEIENIRIPTEENCLKRNKVNATRVSFQDRNFAYMRIEFNVKCNVKKFRNIYFVGRK